MKDKTLNITRIIQFILYIFGISIHNNFTDECVPDFSCCINNHSNLVKRIKDSLSVLRNIIR